MLTRKRKGRTEGEQQFAQNESGAESDSTAKRRRNIRVEKARLSLAEKAKYLFLPQYMFQEIFGKLKAYHGPQSSKPLCTPFIVLPSRRAYPEYYDAIANPIDLNKIQHKLKCEGYSDAVSFFSDCDLLIENALTFYNTDSLERAAAESIRSYLISLLDQLIEKQAEEEAMRSPSSLPKLKEKSSTSSSKKNSKVSKETALQLDDSVLSSGGQETRKRRPSQKMLETTIPFSKKKEKTPKKLLQKELSFPQDDSEERGEADNSVSMMETDTNKDDREKGKKKPIRSSHSDSEDVLSREVRKRKPGTVSTESYVEEPEDSVPEDVLSSGRKKKKKKKHGDHFAITDTSFTEVGSPKTRPIKKGGEAVAEEEQVADNLTVKIPLTESKSRDITSRKMKKSSMKEGMLHILNTVVSKKDFDHRVLSDLFMEKPSRTLYPEYYIVVKRPIDLREIKENITSGKYSKFSEFLQDMETLFRNAQFFNEEDSMVHQDSVTLSHLTCHTLKELWMETKPSQENLDDLLMIMQSAKLPQPFSLSGSKTQLVLSYKAHACIGLPRGELFKYFPSLKRNTTSEERKDIVRKGVCSTTAVAMKVIKFKDLKNIIDIKKEGLTGKEVLQAAVPGYNPRSSKLWLAKLYAESQAEDEDEDDDEEDDNASSDEEQTLSEDFRMIDEMLKALQSAKSPSGRQLFSLFYNLPTKSMKVDHTYAVGKKMMDLQTVTDKVKHKCYTSFNEMLEDLHQVCYAACRYSSSTSIFYCDAVLLHSFILKKKQELLKSTNWKLRRHNVQEKVQSILKRIVKMTTRVKSFSGASPIERLMEVKVSRSKMEGDTQEAEELDLRTIILRVKNGKYHRLDRMQEDCMSVLDHIQASSSPGSQVYQDAVELKRAFLKYRDKVCSNGTLLTSPAFGSLTKEMLNMKDASEVDATVDKNTTEDSQAPTSDVDMETTSIVTKKVGVTQEERLYCDEMEVNGTIYYIGDFVYVQSVIPTKPCHIVLIEKIWETEKSGEKWFNGPWFLRPEETFHVATRKFYEKELFKSEFCQMVNFDTVRGKCRVMHYRDYLKYRPEGYNEEDTYVCESRYIKKAKTFKKYKVWVLPGSHHPDLIRRAEPFIPKRVPSVFAESAGLKTDIGSENETEREEVDNTSSGSILGLTSDSEGNHDSSDEESKPADLNESKDEDYITFNWKSIETTDANPETGYRYYEQFVIDGNRFRLGDFVFVRSEETRPYIARIERMWTDNKDDPWFHGPWFVHPDEVDHLPTRMFYYNEVFLSSIHDTNPMRSVIGRCAVLSPKEYVTYRPTEVFENDVFVCKYKYDEREKDIKPLRILKTFSHSDAVLPDEIYYFEEEIPIIKVPSPNLHEILKNQQVTAVPTPSVTPQTAALPIPILSQPSSSTIQMPKLTSTPDTSAGATKPSAQLDLHTMATAMALMAEDIQKELAGRNMNIPVEVVAKVVSAEWASMTEEQKIPYERKAFIFKAAQTILGTQPQQTSTAAFSAPLTASLHQSLAASTQNLTSGAQSSIPLTQTLQPSTSQQGTKKVVPTAAGGSSSSGDSAAATIGNILKIGNTTLVPGMTLTQQHVQQVNQLLQQLQSTAATAAKKIQQQSSIQSSSSGPSQPIGDKQKPQFLQGEGTRVLHAILYLKYLDDLRKGVKQMSTWEAAGSSTAEATPKESSVSQISQWIDTKEETTDVVDSLKKLNDHLTQHSVDFAKIVQSSNT